MTTDMVDVGPNRDIDALRTRLEAVLADHLGRSVEVGPLRQFPSGFSWITYGFTIDGDGIDGVRKLILRLGPGNGLYAPYSAEPQYAVLAALQGSAVPAPRAFLRSDDPAILGMPFFVSEWSPGEAPIPWGEDGGLAGSHRESLGAQFADALGTLHAFDWRATPLASLGEGVTHENVAAREVDLWEANASRWALRAHPMLTRALGWLRAHLPVAPRLAIVHGDYRLGNFLEVDGRISAILDWELVHIGDPHEDLAWTCLPQYRGGTPLMSKLVSRDELYARHAARTGLPVDPTLMHFYTIFSLVKLAATHMSGAFAFERKGFCDLRMPALGTQIAPVLRQMEKILEAGA